MCFGEGGGVYAQWGINFLQSTGLQSEAAGPAEGMALPWVLVYFSVLPQKLNLRQLCVLTSLLVDSDICLSLRTTYSCKWNS